MLHMCNIWLAVGPWGPNSDGVHNLDGTGDLLTLLRKQVDHSTDLWIAALSQR